MRKKLGDILLEAGVITQEQLENGLNVQKGKNKRFGKVMVELGYVDEFQVAETLAQQLSLPLVDCNANPISPEVLSLVPREIAEERIVLPLRVEEKRLILAMADPLDWQTIDELAFRTGYLVSAAISYESCILSAIEKYYGSSDKVWDLLRDMPQYHVEFVKKEEEEEGEQISVQSLYKQSEAPPIVKLVSMVLADAVEHRASDIHLEPMEKYVQVRYRVDGDMRNVIKYPKHIQDSVTSRIKIISNMDITNRRLPQDGRISLRLADRMIDLRVSTLPSVFGENIVIRLLDHTSGLIPLAKLGIPNHIFKRMVEIFNQPQGMMIITGPTGSGKTTTLYAVLQQLRTETENIFTIEDPVEYQIPGITQVQVNDAIGLSFPAVLRSVLRQDPDIIMVGEIRDSETAEIACRSAITGHLVLSTVHTNDTISTILRLADLGLEKFMITSAVTGIFAQRLVKKICPHCMDKATPPPEIEKMGFPRLKMCFKGKGCAQCRGSGYVGRIGIYEFLVMDARIKELIAKEASPDALWAAARESGTITLFDDAWNKVGEGITTVEEVMARVPFNRYVQEIRRTAP